MFAKLISLDSVIGVGSKGADLVIYLTHALKDHEAQVVYQVLTKEAPNRGFVFVQIGEIKKQ